MLEAANGCLWNLLTAALILIGVWLTLHTGFLQFTRFFDMLREALGGIFRSTKGVSPFGAVSAALSGTMGTGNIIGVGIAIQKGGSGALFWMLISSFICMIIKYAEVYLAMLYREKSNGILRGGAMYCIKNGLSRRFYPLAVIFCVCTVTASLCVGNATQAAALSGAVPLSPAVTGVITALLCAAVIFGSVKYITSVTSVLMPLMTLVYLICSICVIIFNVAALPGVLCDIFKNAFCADSIQGGILGFISASALRHGFAKGMFTNEAGMGSAPIVHAAADNTPQRQGYLGIFEVFVDTTLMCTVTGVAILTAEADALPPELMTGGAFCSVFGGYGNTIVSICVVLFAFAAMLGWSVYGSACCEFLTKRRIVTAIYRIVFCITAFCGCCMPVGSMFELSDLLNGLMALPNLIMILLLARNIPKREKLCKKTIFEMNR